MEKYLLCGELSPALSQDKEEDEGSQENGGRMKVYKGRRRGTVEFCGIWKHSKAVKDLIANGVGSLCFHRWVWPKERVLSIGTLDTLERSKHQKKLLVSANPTDPIFFFETARKKANLAKNFSYKKFFCSSFCDAGGEELNFRRSCWKPLRQALG